MQSVTHFLGTYGPHILQSGALTAALVWLNSEISDKKVLALMYGLPFTLTAFVYFKYLVTGGDKSEILRYFMQRMLPFLVVGVGSFLVFITMLRRYPLFIAIVAMWAFSLAISILLYRFVL